MVRMLAFMPVATPVWLAGTLATIRLAIDAKARPMPRPTRPPAMATSQRVSCARASIAEAATLNVAPVASCALALKTAWSRPATMPATNIALTIGSMSRPAWLMLAPKP